MMGEGRDEIRRRHAKDADMALHEAQAGMRIGRLPYGKDPADRVVAVSAPLHRQWDRVRGAGVEGFPLPTLWHRAT